MGTTIRHKRTNSSTIGSLKTGEIGVAANKIYFGPVPAGGDTSSNVTPEEIITSTALSTRLSSYATTSALNSGLNAKMDTTAANSNFPTYYYVSQNYASKTELNTKLSTTTAASTYATKAELSNLASGSGYQQKFWLKRITYPSSGDSILYTPDTYEHDICITCTNRTTYRTCIYMYDFKGRKDSDVYINPGTAVSGGTNYTARPYMIKLTPFVALYKNGDSSATRYFKVRIMGSSCYAEGVCSRILVDFEDATETATFNFTVNEFVREIM